MNHMWSMVRVVALAGFAVLDIGVSPSTVLAHEQVVYVEQRINCRSPRLVFMPSRSFGWDRSSELTRWNWSRHASNGRESWQYGHRYTRPVRRFCRRFP